MRDGHVITKTFADALWSWRKVKTQTDTVSSSIDKGLSCVQRDIHTEPSKTSNKLLKRHFEHYQQRILGRKHVTNDQANLTKARRT